MPRWPPESARPESPPAHVATIPRRRTSRQKSSERRSRQRHRAPQTRCAESPRSSRAAPCTLRMSRFYTLYEAINVPVPLFVERNLRVSAESMVLGVPDGQPDPLRSAFEIQRVVAVCGDGEPEITVHFLTQRSEMRKQIFALQCVDLRHGLPFAADHRIILLRHP